MTDIKLDIIKTRVTAQARTLKATWTMESWYEDFPNKTIHKEFNEDGLVGVHLSRCKSQDFINYVNWCRETFGAYGGAWVTGGGGSNRIYFTHEKYYNWFMLKWG